MSDSASFDASESSPKEVAYVALGANLGDRMATIKAALVLLQQGSTLSAFSAIYETKPWGYVAQPHFLNAAVRLDTRLSPRELLRDLQRIEQELGRVRTFQNAPRTIDLDLLLYGNSVIQTPDLIVPHPRLHERGFVLVPLAEISADVVHPGFGLTIGQLRDRLDAEDGLGGVERFAPPPNLADLLAGDRRRDLQ